MFFYFVSKDDNLNARTLYPRIPLNKFNNEDTNINRICVSKSIIGCLSATGGYNIGDRVSIYQIENNDFYEPSISEVIDSPLTGEVWILNSVKLNFFSLIEINSINYIEMNNLIVPVYGFIYCNNND